MPQNDGEDLWYLEADEFTEVRHQKNLNGRCFESLSLEPEQPMPGTYPCLRLEDALSLQ
jgi:hypothetical protein